MLLFGKNHCTYWEYLNWFEKFLGPRHPPFSIAACKSYLCSHLTFYECDIRSSASPALLLLLDPCLVGWLVTTHEARLFLRGSIKNIKGLALPRRHQSWLVIQWYTLCGSLCYSQHHALCKFEEAVAFASAVVLFCWNFIHTGLVQPSICREVQREKAESQP